MKALSSRGAARDGAATPRLLRAGAISAGFVFIAFSGALLSSSTLLLKATGLLLTGLLLALIALRGFRLRRTEMLTLRLKVQTLEAALQEQQSLPVPQAAAELGTRSAADLTTQADPDVVKPSVADLEREVAQARADEWQRIILTIQAMREATALDPAAEQVLNRVEAAVARLSTSHRTGRPTLPAQAARGRVSQESPPKKIPASPLKVTPPSLPKEDPRSPLREAPPPSLKDASSPRSKAPPSLMPAGAPVTPFNVKVLPVPAPTPEPGATRGSSRRFGRDRGQHSKPRRPGVR
jgi:hypothetical protein